MSRRGAECNAPKRFGASAAKKQPSHNPPSHHTHHQELPVFLGHDDVRDSRFSSAAAPPCATSLRRTPIVTHMQPMGSH